MDSVIKFIMETNFQTVIATIVIFWIFYQRIDKKFEKIDARFEKLEVKLRKIDEKITNIVKCVCRLEGAITSKDCCMLKSDSNLKQKID